MSPPVMRSRTPSHWSIRTRLGGSVAATLTASAIVTWTVSASAEPTAVPATAADAAESESLARPPPRHAYLQYGVAFTVESVAHAGPVCGNPSSPCILGSGGGIDIRAGWRPTEDLYIGGAYEFSKQDPSKLYRLAILQQARVEARHYFPTGRSSEPFALLGAGVAGYGNEWTVSTWGPMGTIGGGIEFELAGGALLGMALAYRPIYLRSFVDSSSPVAHDGGFAHFVGLELALEAQDTL